MVKNRDGRLQEDALAVHCFCVCSGSALLGDLLGISRSMERDLLSVLSIYPRIFLRVFIVYRLLVGFLFVLLYYMLVLAVLIYLSVLAQWKTSGKLEYRVILYSGRIMRTPNPSLKNGLGLTLTVVHCTIQRSYTIHAVQYAYIVHMHI